MTAFAARAVLSVNITGKLHSQQFRTVALRSIWHAVICKRNAAPREQHRQHDETDIRGFVLARDNQICCFGRTPKEYDLIDTFLRKGVTTHYIQSRPFDVVGVFHIKSEIEKYTAMYELEDAIVIEK